jgi:hypothetical protein
MKVHFLLLLRLYIPIDYIRRECALELYYERNHEHWSGGINVRMA